MVIQNGINASFGTNINYTVEVFEAFWLEHTWVHIIFEMPIVEGYTDSVQAERLVELGIRVGEEVFEELQIDQTRRLRGDNVDVEDVTVTWKGNKDQKCE